MALRHGLPARGGMAEHTRALRRRGVATTDVFSNDYCGGPLGPAELLAVVAKAAQACPEGGTIELMCHPGRVDAALGRRSTYVEERRRELATLCSRRDAGGSDPGLSASGGPRRSGDRQEGRQATPIQGKLRRVRRCQETNFTYCVVE